MVDAIHALRYMTYSSELTFKGDIEVKESGSGSESQHRTNSIESQDDSYNCNRKIVTEPFRLRVFSGLNHH